MTTARAQLLLGVVPAPAPPEIAEAFESLTVTQTDSGITSGWQLALRADRKTTPANDVDLVEHPLLRPFTRVIVSLSTGSGLPTVLLDGFITHLELTPSQNGQGGLLTITGDGVDAMMDFKDFTTGYPGYTDEMIVGEVLLKYTAVGVIPEIVPPIPPGDIPDPLESCVVQNSTDMCFLRKLATRYGYVFYVKPGPTVGMNTAYWGPPKRILPPQHALTVDMGQDTNVDSLSFAYDAKAPTLVFGKVRSEMLGIDIPVPTTVPLRVPPLAAEPAVITQLPFVDSRLYSNPAFEPAQALWEANAITHTSTDRVVTAKGSLDVARYGHVLDAPGVVGVRGAGFTYDGNYYVNSVTHHLAVGSFTQDFELAREGTGSTVGSVAV